MSAGVVNLGLVNVFFVHVALGKRGLAGHNLNILASEEIPLGSARVLVLL